MVTEYRSEKEALETASKMLGIPIESIRKTEPEKVFYEFPIYKWLEVYELETGEKKVSFGVGSTRTHGRKVFYGLWLIDGEDIRRV